MPIYAILAQVKILTQVKLRRCNRVKRSQINFVVGSYIVLDSGFERG